jgi:2'-5' RNA ligase
LPPLYTLAYPTVSASDRALLDRFRAEHDLRYRDVVAPHFTLAFGCTAVAEDDYCRHVAAVAQRTPAITFSCRYAMLGADHAEDTGYVFLVPDEGYAALSRLHDALYSGPLEPHLRLDIPYVPHVTIGTLADRRLAKQLCDELNVAGVRIEGRVGAVCVGALADGRIRDLATFPLAAEPPF